MTTTATDSQIEQLEQAILQRAQSLADTHLRNAQQQRDKIITNSQKRLQRREEQATETAKSLAEREYRRQVQSNEIQLQGDLDQLRWSLIQSVMNSLRERLAQLTEQKNSYLPILKQYFLHAVQAIEGEELEVLVNPRDHALLTENWAEFEQAASPKRCQLTTSKQNFLGGLMVRTQDQRIQVNNTFEGLIERLEMQLYQEITTHLFASANTLRSL